MNSNKDANVMWDDQRMLSVLYTQEFNVEHDRRLMQPDFQEEYELDCKGRASDIQSAFNTTID